MAEISKKDFSTNTISLDIQRSSIRIPFEHKTTLKAGDLVPLYWDEVTAGTTISMDVSQVFRLLTPAVPVMDNAFIDSFFFFVPMRLIAEKYKENHSGSVKLFTGPSVADWETFFGANKSTAWYPATETSMTTCQIQTLAEPMSVGNYLGVPCNKFNTAYVLDHYADVNPLLYIAYTLIWNEWFRDESTQAPLPLDYGLFSDDINHWYMNIEDANTSYLSRNTILHSNKYPDYFTRALPAPQRGPSVYLPLGSLAPVITTPNNNANPGNVGLHFGTSLGTTLKSGLLGVSSDAILGTSTSGSYTASQALKPINLWTDLSSATSATINNLRQAFAVQRFYEAMARSGGGRYIEILQGIFGTSPTDARLQRPEYLGGFHNPVMINQVLQTSASATGGTLGATGAMSQTNDSYHAFTASFTEPGYILALFTVRNEQSYSQGLNKKFFHTRLFDFYFPQFANLGEQPVFTKELFLDSPKEQVFGYQEAWSEYRFKPNLVTGNLAPGAGDLSLTPWTFTNNFSSAPILNSSFKVQPSSQIGDTLVDTNTETQFVCDVFFNSIYTQPMPVESVPGLIDHH